MMPTTVSPRPTDALEPFLVRVLEPFLVEDGWFKDLRGRQNELDLFARSS